MENVIVTERRKRLGGAERREQILQAAKEIYLSEGTDGTSMRNIARRAGITPALIYHHFSDKDELLLHLTENFFRTFESYRQRELEGVTDPIEGVRAHMRAYIACGLDHPNEYQLAYLKGLPQLMAGESAERRLAAYRASGRSKDWVGEGGLTWLTHAYDGYDQIVSAAVETGRTRTKSKSVFGQIMWHACHGFVSMRTMHPSYSWVPNDRLTDELIETVIKGLLK